MTRPRTARPAAGKRQAAKKTLMPLYIAVLLVGGQGLSAHTTKPVDEADIAGAFQKCSPTAAEIQTDQAQKSEMPEHMRELTEVDYRLARCERIIRVCTDSARSPACRELVREWVPAAGGCD